jgi:hypothetical protein
MNRGNLCYLCCLSAGLCLGYFVRCAAYWAQCKIVRWVARRNDARCSELADQFSGKYFRHRPTGRVGICVGYGMGAKGSWSWLWLMRVVFAKRYVMEVVTCADCMDAVKAMGGMAMNSVRSFGHSEVWRVSETAPALDAEVREFRTRL